jgi:hypothetical protein
MLVAIGMFLGILLAPIVLRAPVTGVMAVLEPIMGFNAENTACELISFN